MNNFVIKTSDRPLTNKSVIKYLGVLFDNKLNWEQHIQYVLAKLCIARGVLMKLRHYAPVAVLRNVYFGIVYSYLKYGVTTDRVYGGDGGDIMHNASPGQRGESTIRR